MNRALRRLSVASLALFVVLLAWVNYLQVFRVNSLAGEPGNSRVFYQQFKNQRGEIIAAGIGGGPQQVIAESKLIKGGIYQRYYPHGTEYAPVTGYDSLFSNSGIELTDDKYLNGSASSLTIFNLKGLFTGHGKQGASVLLTIDPRAQAAAYAALAAMGKPAAAVAIDPKTGAILALASYPTFDPNKYATLDSQRLTRIDNAYRNDPSQPLTNRAITDTGTPPGSTFKIITSSTAFMDGKVANQNSTIPAPVGFPLPGSSSVIHNDNFGPCANGNPQIIEAFTLSCNTAFAKLGVKVGGPRLVHYADLFGFNNFGRGPNAAPLTIPIPASLGVIAPNLSDPGQTAQSAIGQFSDTVTPLQEAMMAATVANGGVLMRPYMVQAIRAPDQELVQQATPTAIGRVLRPQVASYLTQMMEAVTHRPEGTAYFTAGPPATGIDIAGKTGTAENGATGQSPLDAVFTSFAPSTSPRIAVAVIVKGGGFGAAAAAPIAVKIIQAYLGQH